MRRILAAVPLPIAGVALGFAALGNLLLPILSWLSIISESIAIGIILLLFIKIFLDLKAFFSEMKNPVVATTFATFDMALMIIFTYFKGHLGVISTLGWGVAIILHIWLLLYVIKTFMVKLELSKIFPTYFIPFVGYVVISITSPAYGMESLGKIVFWFGLCSFLAILFLLIRKIQKKIPMPKGTYPTYMIVAAPPSLCLAGYLSAFEKGNIYLTVGLAILSLVATLFSYYIFFKMDHKEFYPSFSAATFPFVISAIGMKKFTSYLALLGINIKWLSAVGTVELIIAVIACVYIFIYYLAIIKREMKLVKS